MIVSITDVFSFPVFQPLYRDVFSASLPPIIVDPTNPSPALSGLIDEDGHRLLSEDGFLLLLE